MTMTRKLNNDNGLQDWRTEPHVETDGVFYRRDSEGFSVSTINKRPCNLIEQGFEIGNKIIHTST